MPSSTSSCSRITQWTSSNTSMSRRAPCRITILSHRRWNRLNHLKSSLSWLLTRNYSACAKKTELFSLNNSKILWRGSRTHPYLCTWFSKTWSGCTTRSYNAWFKRRETRVKAGWPLQESRSDSGDMCPTLSCYGMKTYSHQSISATKAKSWRL